MADPIDLLYQMVKKRHPNIKLEQSKNKNPSNHIDAISLAVVDIFEQIDKLSKREHPYSDDCINDSINLLNENRYLSYNLVTENVGISPFQARKIMTIIKSEQGDLVEFYGGKGGKRFLCRPSDLKYVRALFGKHPRERRVKDRIKRILRVLEEETDWDDYKSIKEMYETIYPLHTTQQISYFIRQIRGVYAIKQKFLRYPYFEDLLIAKPGTLSEKKLNGIIEEKRVREGYTRSLASLNFRTGKKSGQGGRANSLSHDDDNCDKDPKKDNPTPRHCCDCVYLGNQNHLGDKRKCRKTNRHVSLGDDACDNFKPIGDKK